MKMRFLFKSYNKTSVLYREKNCPGIYLSLSFFFAFVNKCLFRRILFIYAYTDADRI